MAIIFDGDDYKPAEIVSVSKKEQKFLYILKNQNISEFIKHIKKSNTDYFNKPVAGLNVILMHYALEKMYSKNDNQDFYKNIFKISLYKTKSETMREFNYSKNQSSIFKYALAIGKRSENYLYFIQLLIHFKKDFIEYNIDLLKGGSVKDLAEIGLNKKDLLFFFNNTHFYKAIINTDTSLYMNLFSRFSEYSEDEISHVAKVNTVNLFEKNWAYKDFKNSINQMINNWLMYSFEAPEISHNYKQKAIIFVRSKYLFDQNNHNLDLSLEYISKILNPIIEKNIIEQTIDVNKDSSVSIIKKRI